MNNDSTLKIPDLSGAVLLRKWCNIFGGENDGGAKRVLGGLETGRPSVQWYCKRLSIGRYRMQCVHGHKGQLMEICGVHVQEFRGGKVTFCPRCNIEPPGHKCKLSLQEVS